MIELAIVLVLVLLNGVFSLSELAVVSSRRPRLRAMAEAGRPGARAALALGEDPGRFLSTVQIGITLVGVLAGAFSGSALGGRLAAVLEGAGLSRGWAEPIGFGLVVAAITYLSIVVGELAPKRLALRSPEGIACAVARPMAMLSRAMGPVVWLLDASTDAVFRLLGLRDVPASAVTDEEIRTVVAEAASAGVIEPEERLMISGVMRLGDRPVRGIMTPRTDVDWIDLAAPEGRQREVLVTTRHSRLPAGEGSIDAMLGVVQTREVLAHLLAGRPLDMRAHVHKAPVIPDTAEALDALAALRGAAVPVALVHDEYGHFQGVVTPADVLETIAGAFHAGTGADDPGAVRREDGSWLLSGWLAVDEMAEHLGLRLPPERDYQTAAGYVLAASGRLPTVGEHVRAGGWRFEVVDLDGHRIDKLIAVPVEADTTAALDPPRAVSPGQDV